MDLRGWQAPDKGWGAVQSFAAGETVADVSHARLLSKSVGSEQRWHGGPVGDALGEAGGASRLRTRRRSASSMGSEAKLIRPDGACERKPAVDRRIGGDAGVAASGEALRAPTVREGLSLSCISPPSVHLVAARQGGSSSLHTLDARGSVCWRVEESSLTVGGRELSHSAQESFRVSSKLIRPDGADPALSQHSFRKTLNHTRVLNHSCQNRTNRLKL